MKVGVDTGGTFTDVVAADGRSTKVLSTPEDPARAVGAGIASLLDVGTAGGPEAESVRPEPPPKLLAHGTTVATNALLERRGANVGLVTSAGLRDVVEIARQDRPSLYDPFADRPEPLVPRAWRYEVPRDLARAGGEPGEPGHLEAVLDDLDPDIEVVAVCLLHADLDPGDEKLVAEALRRRGWEVTCSHEVSPEMREYERTVTTVISSSLRPRTRGYLLALYGLAGEVLVMTSAGGLLPASETAEAPAAMLLSGPAGGVRAGAAAAVANGFPDAITFDMGGTSTDVCLILDGAPAPAAQREVGGFTVRYPSLDVHTIGAGGGSIARIDAGGALVVGPRSAGADPGPACYGRGGTEPTVTDANLVAGRIPQEAAFGGLALNRAAAVEALERAGVTAEGVLAVVDANMERALRAVSVERGVDPRRLALVAFGGAGPLHACALAEALEMPAVIVPGRAGVCSAVGLLTAPRRRDVVRSWPQPDDHSGLVEALEALGSEVAAMMIDSSRESSVALGGSGPLGSSERSGPADGPGRATGTPDVGSAGDGPDVGGAGHRPAVGCGVSGAEGSPAAGSHVPGAGGETGPGTPALPSSASSDVDVQVSTSVDCRYRGQSHELTVPTVEAFHEEHARRNGYQRPDQSVEVVAIRAEASLPPAIDPAALPLVEREGEITRLYGPRVLAEPDCTVWIPEGWVATPGAGGALVLRREGSA